MSFYVQSERQCCGEVGGLRIQDAGVGTDATQLCAT